MKGTRKPMTQETCSITLSLRELSRQGLKVDMIVHKCTQTISWPRSYKVFTWKWFLYSWIIERRSCWWFSITVRRQISTNYIHTFTESFSLCFWVFIICKAVNYYKAHVVECAWGGSGVGLSLTNINESYWLVRKTKVALSLKNNLILPQKGPLRSSFHFLSGFLINSWHHSTMLDYDQHFFFPLNKSLKDAEISMKVSRWQKFWR